MTTDEKIKEAKRLMIEVSKERRQKIKDNSDNEICKCGHKFKTHTHTLSINYTAGFCSISKCNCEHFLTKFNPSNS